MNMIIMITAVAVTVIIVAAILHLCLKKTEHLEKDGASKEFISERLQELDEYETAFLAMSNTGDMAYINLINTAFCRLLASNTLDVKEEEYESGIFYLYKAKPDVDMDLLKSIEKLLLMEFRDFTSLPLARKRIRENGGFPSLKEKLQKWQFLTPADRLPACVNAFARAGVITLCVGFFPGIPVYLLLLLVFHRSIWMALFATVTIGIIMLLGMLMAQNILYKGDQFPQHFFEESLPTDSFWALRERCRLQSSLYRNPPENTDILKKADRAMYAHCSIIA